MQFPCFNGTVRFLTRSPGAEGRDGGNVDDVQHSHDQGSVRSCYPQLGEAGTTKVGNLAGRAGTLRDGEFPPTSFFY